MALCSESIGRIVTPASRGGAHENVAGGNQAFLVGEGEPRARRMARIGRRKPGRADDRGNHQVGRPLGGFDHGSGARPRPMPVPASAALSVAVRSRIGDRPPSRAPAVRAMRGKLRGIGIGGDGLDGESVRQCAR